MHPIRKKLNKNIIIKSLSSVKIAVACLCLLFILTLWGTIDQVNNGLYLSQERFFNSWMFIFWGFVPFPGARLVLWVLFINLVCVSLVRFVYRWSKLGIIVIHIGLLLFFVAAFVTFHCTVESNITFMEGEGSNVSKAYHQWELSLWTQQEDKKQVIAFDADHLRRGQELNFGNYGFKAMIHSYCRNCEAYGESDRIQGEMVFNVSGIQSLNPISLDKEPQKNYPGVTLRLEGPDQGPLNILLFGGESKPLKILKDGTIYFMQLRLRGSPLPFLIRLKDFKMEKHPRTEIARSYESLVEVISGGVSREVLISMNEPMRYKNFTLYQASYAIDQFGREFSTLAVVKNSGRLLPYIATFTTVAGLLIHLLMMAFPSSTKVRRKKK